MIRNVSQWSGVIALIAVVCLVALGATGDRIVTAASGQIGQAGNTGTAIAIGGCNRCAWNYKSFVLANHPPGVDVVILPRGTSGVVRYAQVSGTGGGFKYAADCFEAGATDDSDYVFQSLPYDDNGVRFIDGVIARFPTVVSAHDVYVYIWYRLD